jgi:hypothetical protein
MQISGVSLTLTWPHRLCLLRVLLGTMPLPQAFPFSSTLGEVTLHPLSQACVFIYSSHGKWVFPPLLWSFPPTATFTSFSASGCWVCATAPAFSSWLVRDFPSPPLWCSGHSPLFDAQAPHPLATCLFCYCLLFSFSFFPGCGSVCPGGYADLAQDCLWKYCVPLSSPCGPHLPKLFGHWRLASVLEPSLFLRLTWSGNATYGLEVWRSQSFASSRWFFL